MHYYFQPPILPSSEILLPSWSMFAERISKTFHSFSPPFNLHSLLPHRNSSSSFSSLSFLILSLHKPGFILLILIPFHWMQIPFSPFPWYIHVNHSPHMRTKDKRWRGREREGSEKWIEQCIKDGEGKTKFNLISKIEWMNSKTDFYSDFNLNQILSWNCFQIQYTSLNPRIISHYGCFLAGRSFRFHPTFIDRVLLTSGRNHPSNFPGCSITR